MGGVGERMRMDSSHHEPGEVGDVRHQHRVYLGGYRGEGLEIPGPGIGGGSCPDQTRAVFESHLAHLVKIDEMGFGMQLVLYGLVLDSREVDLPAMGQVAAEGQAHAHDAVPGLAQRQVDGLVCRRA